MINFTDGIIEIDKEFTVSPEFSFEDFMQTPYYNGQNRNRMIYIDSVFNIDSHKYVISMYFTENRINRLSMICCDVSFTFETEPERKKIHDEILEQYGIHQLEDFKWGKVVSDYDAKGNISSIDFFFKH